MNLTDRENARARAVAALVDFTVNIPNEHHKKFYTLLREALHAEHNLALAKTIERLDSMQKKG